MICLRLNFLVGPVTEVNEWLSLVWNTLLQQQQSLTVVCAWMLWHERNSVLFGAAPTPTDVLINKVKDYESNYSLSIVVS